jgi:hypothetical protein
MRRPLPDPREVAEILARRRTKPTPRPPPAAARSLGPLLKSLEARFGQGAGVLQTRWREIVGETLARHTEPVKLVKSRTGSILELRVAGPAAAIVQHQSPEILARAAMVLGEGEVTKLRIVQGPIRGPGLAARPMPGRKRTKPPLDAAAEQALAEGLADQPDGPLKTALERLGREILRQGGR